MRGVLAGVGAGLGHVELKLLGERRCIAKRELVG